jgi:type IV secretory pathway VirB10-like protein
MATSTELMREQAARLFALAAQAHDRGDTELADLLTAAASRWLDQATEAENTGAPPPPLPSEQQQPVAQQQQQIQPEKDDTEKDETNGGS